MSDYVTKTNVLSALARFKENTDALYETKADANDMKSEINQHDARLQNLEQKAGDYSIVQYRGTNAVPTGKAKYGLVKSIVGKTRAWNQLVDSGTSSVTLTNGHKYLTVINGTFSIVIGAGSAISVTGGTDCVYDLTLIFGAGNEPSTVADALAQLPALGQYNAYDAGSLVDTVVSGVRSRDTSDNVLDTLSLPETVTLRGVGTCVETLDLETGVPNDGKFGLKNLGDLSYYYDTGYSVFLSSEVQGMRLPTSSSDTHFILCNRYAVSDIGSANSPDMTIYPRIVNGKPTVGIKNSNYTDASAFKATLSGVYLLYEKATYTPSSPIAPITDNFIEVEGGGTIETIQTQTPVIDNCLDVGYLAL